MSKIGKQPIEILDGVTVSIENKRVDITGPKGNFSYSLPEGIAVKNVNNRLVVSQTKNISSIFGLVRATLANMIIGVRSGFEKQLELSGVGFRAQVTGNDLTLSLGFSHPVKVTALAGINFKVSENIITISGIDKVLVGDTAAKIRSIKPPEPYKGKGISYKGERIRRKVGKAAKAVGGKS